VPIDAEYPGDFGRDLLFEIEERDRELIKLAAALSIQNRRTGVEEQLRLEHETIAHHPDVRPRSENFSQLAEEVGAIARQLLHPLGQRHIEPLTEVSDAGLRVFIAFFRGVESLLEGCQLAAQGRDLL